MIPPFKVPIQQQALAVDSSHHFFLVLTNDFREKTVYAKLKVLQFTRYSVASTIVLLLSKVLDF